MMVFATVPHCVRCNRLFTVNAWTVVCDDCARRGRRRRGAASDHARVAHVPDRTPAASGGARPVDAESPRSTFRQRAIAEGAGSGHKSWEIAMASPESTELSGAC